MRRFYLGFTLTSISAFALAGSAIAEGWGNIKGQVVFGGKSIPEAKKVEVNKDQQHCLSKGPIVSDELVIDKASGGVANVMVWLAPVTKGDKIPINPDVKAVPKDKVVIDQPCCMFVPRVTMMREGQSLTIKNNKFTMGTGSAILVAGSPVDGSTLTGNNVTGSGAHGIYVASPAKPNSGNHVIDGNTISGYREGLFIDLTLHPGTVLAREK